METIKITSGTLRGRNLKSPRLETTHPMGSREKLALFNMLAGIIEDAEVLDAYAGSGSLGIEALSRGAKNVTFIEKHPKVVKIIHENLKNLNLNDSASVETLDVKKFQSPRQFDIIIADPPYGHFDKNEVAGLADFLKLSGIFVLSHPNEAPEISGLKLLKSHRYASAHISIYQK